jgi:hypothetical protein
MITPDICSALVYLRFVAEAGQVEPQVLLHLLERVEALENDSANTAAVDGAAYSQVQQNLLERVEALEADVIEQPQSSRFCNEAIVRRLETLEAAENLRQQDEDAEPAAPTPEATPPPAPAGGLVRRVIEAIIEGMVVRDPEAASAAIREVAAWMRENETGYNAARWLELEADR